MNDTITEASSETNADAPETIPYKPTNNRTFLCVVDDSVELAQALSFACSRSVNTGGRIALLYVMQPAEFQHWAAIADKMREEAREEAEEMLQVISAVVQKRTGAMPVCYIREGKTHEELIKLIDEEHSISLLVLGAASGTDGPGPLLSHLVEKRTGELRVPVTMVPGNLTDEEIEAIT